MDIQDNQNRASCRNEDTLSEIIFYIHFISGKFKFIDQLDYTIKTLKSKYPCELHLCRCGTSYFVLLFAKRSRSNLQGKFSCSPRDNKKCPA
jgi:hypothetical protein